MIFIMTARSSNSTYCQDEVPLINDTVANYCILLVNSRGYYQYQVEIGVATNRDFNIKIVRKT